MFKNLGLGIVLVATFMLSIPVHASTNDQLKEEDFSKAMLATTEGATLYDGNKLSFQDEQDQLIFSDDFSSNDFSKWTYNMDTNIVKDGLVNAAVFSRGSEIDLSGLSSFNRKGYYRIAYDVKFENYNDQSDSGTITYFLEDELSGNVQIKTSNIPIKVGEWQHVQDVYVSTGSNLNNSLRIKGPETPTTANANMYITNFKIYKISPTYTEDFSDGTIDERFTTNSKFEYSVVDDNGTKALKIDMPYGSLPVGDFEDVLIAKETLAPAWYDPEKGAKQEGISYLTHQAFSNNDSTNTSVIRNMIFDNHGHFSSREHMASSLSITYPNFFSANPYIGELFTTADTLNSSEVTYGVAVGAYANMFNTETLYIKDIQVYKAEVLAMLNDNTIKRVVSTN